MSYQHAKPRRGPERIDSVVITPGHEEGSVQLWLMGSEGGITLPFGRSYHASEEEAKKDCLETMGILDSDWVVAEGEPEWAAGVNEAIRDAIGQYLAATGDDEGEVT